MGLFGGGGKGGSTTVTQNNEPPKWAEPLFKQSAGIARNLYNSGTGFNVYPGSTVAEPSRNTTLGMQGMTNVALDPASYSLAQNPAHLTNQVLEQGGLMDPASQALGFYGNMAAGQYNPNDWWFRQLAGTAGNIAPSTDARLGQFSQGAFDVSTDPFSNVQDQATQFGNASNAMFDPFRTGQIGIGTGIFEQLMNQALQGGASPNEFYSGVLEGDHQIGTGQDFRDIYGRAQLPGAAEDYLTTTARGDYLEDGNPYFRQWLEKEADRLGDQITGTMSASGRYGSGAHQGVMGEEIGNFMLQGLSDDFARERGLQMQAAQTIESAQQGRLGQQLAAIHGLTGVEGQNLANRMTAAGRMTQDDLARLGMAGQMATTGAGFDAQNIANQMAAAQTQAGIGQNLLGLQRGLAGDITGLDSENIARQLSSSLAQRQFAGDDFQRQMAAAGDLFNARQQNLQNQFTGAQSAADLSNQGLVNALNYIGALPTIQQNRLFAPQLLQQMGAQQDQSNQAAINDMVRRFYAQDMAPWTRLGALQAAAQGSAGQYGTMHQVSQQPANYNPLFQLGGGLLSLMGGF